MVTIMKQHKADRKGGKSASCSQRAIYASLREYSRITRRPNGCYEDQKGRVGDFFRQCLWTTAQVVCLYLNVIRGHGGFQCRAARLSIGFTTLSLFCRGTNRSGSNNNPWKIQEMVVALRGWQHWKSGNESPCILVLERRKHIPRLDMM